jgi:hypothetical protein
MGKYIILGKYNKLYKYIWIYLILRFLKTFIFNNNLIFIDDLSLDLPDSPFIFNQIDYVGYLIFSTILIIIKKYQEKKAKNEDLNNDDKLIYNEPDAEINFVSKKDTIVLYIYIFFLVIRDLLESISPKFGFSMFTYWMFEMLYYELFSFWKLKTNIYRHHIFSFIFILSFCSIFRSIDIVIKFENNTYDAKFLDDKKRFIPISFIFYFLFRVFKTYTYINIKFYFEKKVIPINYFMLFYGLFGVISTFIGAMISTFIPCGDNTLSKLSKKVCNYHENNQTIYYFDSYNIYYEKVLKNNLTGKIFMIISRAIINFGSTYFIYVIYKKLNPLYYICLHRLNVLILNILGFIKYVTNGEDIDKIYIYHYILDTLSLVFYLIGSIIYLEFIELNFCKLNFYTKIRIEERSSNEIKYSLEDISINSENDDNETNNK